MARRGVLLMSAFTLLSGCTALRPSAETIEYRPGAEPITTAATCDAAYTLEALDDTRNRYAAIDVQKGQAVGFRREPGGSLVAVAGAQTYTLTEGRYTWRYTPKPVTRWDRFAVGTRDRCVSAADGVYLFFMMPFIVYNCCTTGEWP